MSSIDEDDFQDLYHASLRRKLEAQDYIGERRLRIIDRKWTGSASAQARTLQDMGTTVEDLDAQGEYEMPTYRRAPPDAKAAGTSGTGKTGPSAPIAPSDPNGARKK